MKKVVKKPRQRERPMRMCSEDGEVYLTPQHLLDEKVRTNVLGQVVPKKQIPIFDDENDTDGQNYTLARTESKDGEVTQPSITSNKKRRSNRGICEVISQWKCRKSVVVLIGIILVLFVVIGIMAFGMLKGNRGK